MWQVALELSSKYPLGIGYRNSRIMHEIEPEIPTNLKHFHNNTLNLIVEAGWFAGAVFIWWIIALLAAAYSERRDVLIAAIGCALLSFQVAGLVEYNIGDSEVLLVAFSLIGVLYGLIKDSSPRGQVA
jgi:O-antigen ligase